VVITSRPCLLIKKAKRSAPLFVDKEKCTGCGLCLKLGCPAIETEEDGGKRKAKINAAMCTGCNVCAQVCRFKAFGGTE
jgi:indolepyruvate ferredoxin oxidoreductase alpha subunit